MSLPSRKPAKTVLGTRDRRVKGALITYQITVVMLPDKVDPLIIRAMESKRGRVTVGGGAFTILAKRVMTPVQAGAEASSPAAPAANHNGEAGSKP